MGGSGGSFRSGHDLEPVIGDTSSSSLGGVTEPLSHGPSDRDGTSPHGPRCPECRGRKLVPGITKTTGMGSGSGSAYGPCPKM